MPSEAETISTVVALFRVSTEAQEKTGYSLQAQQTAYERDCHRFGWRSLGVFEGQESGSSLSLRRTIHELIEFLRTRRPDAVWVIEQSRLTRGDELDVALLLRELREHGARVVIERGTVIDPTDLEGAFMFRLKALMDRREWELITARNKRGKDEKAKKGLHAHGRPAYGYTIAGEGRERGKRVPVESEAQVVRWIFEWVADGHSMRRVVEMLADRGIPAPTQSGRPSGRTPARFHGGLQLWGRTTIRRILSNPIYLGVSYRHCWRRQGKSFVFDRSNPDAIWIDDAHEAIVTPELWEAAHRQMSLKRSHTHLHLHMLTGLLRCPHCDESYVTTTSQDQKDGPIRRYYMCRTKLGSKNAVGGRRRTGRACPSRWLKVEETDKIVWDAFVALVTSPEMIERYLESTPATQRRAGLRAEITQLQQAAGKVEQRLAKAREKLLSEVLTDGEYLSVREQLTGELGGIQRHIAQKSAELRSMSGEVTMQTIRNLATLKLGEKKLSADQRSRLFHNLVRCVKFSGKARDRIEIELYVGGEPGATRAGYAESLAGGERGVVRIPIDLREAVRA